MEDGIKKLSCKWRHLCHESVLNLVKCYMKNHWFIVETYCKVNLPMLFVLWC